MSPLLLEENAEGLESFQYLANRILHRDGRIPGRVSFDAGDYRAKQEEVLLEQARAAAEEVVRTGKTRKMPPMGPYERRLIHLALAEVEGVRTYSTGSGYRRRLHIAPRSPESSEDA
ncbi:MAG: R3H domain-containing nucleic acid-binding protein [Acidobacteriota bacterium]|nr:R3H domain-containing nucleic acid-binding protein [Acidobacteriota bacterium]